MEEMKPKPLSFEHVTIGFISIFLLTFSLINAIGYSYK